MPYLGNDLTSIVKQGKKAYEYVATAGQTVFTGNDSNGESLAITTSSFVSVFLNGIRLIVTDDYTVSTNTITLTSGASLNDELVIVADIEAATFNTYTKAETDVKIVELSPPTDLSAYSTTTQMNTAISNAVNGLVDSAPGTLDTLNEIAAALGDDPNFASTITTSLANKASLTSGTTQPSSPSTGDLWYDTNTGVTALKIYNGTGFIKVSAAIPTLTGISGDITKNQSGNLTLTGTNFLASNLVVTFTAGGTDYDVTVTPADNTSATVAIPAGIYGQNGGVVVTIKVTNSDGVESNSQSKTVIALPSGGTMTTSGGYTIHTFTSSDTFNTENNSLNVEYLVVGGGGGGGSTSQWAAGGGGAGGMLTGSTTLNGSYAIAVGSGGSGGTGNVYESGSSGGSSSIGSVVTTVGGGYGSTAGGVNGGNGGSGGGSGAGPSHSGGSGTSGQGNDGGTGEQSTGSGANSPWGGGGGGGKGSSGGGGTNAGGSGGNGASSSITGSSVTYAGGGGGGEYNNGNPGSGGSGGGGNGASGSTNAGHGGTNLGSGGGGAGATGNGGNGGSGIVVIRYPSI